MMNTYSIKYLKITLGLFLLPFVAFAQQPSVQTFIDKNDILIGEQIQYKVKASFITGAYKVNWLSMPDSTAHFELVEKSRIDTTVENDKTILQQTLTLTSFDSGRWNTPALSIDFDPLKNDSAVHLYTDSVPVTVGYAPADSTNELRDIKPIQEVNVTNYLWYYIGAGIIILLAGAYFLWRYFKNKPKEANPQFNSKLSAYDEAMQALDALKKLQLQQPCDIKKYHDGMSGAFRWYLSRKQRVSILNKTTGDVLVMLAGSNLSKEIISTAATALRCGDAVKFAKYLPAVSESEDCMNKIKEVINYIHSPKNPKA